MAFVLQAGNSNERQMISQGVAGKTVLDVRTVSNRQVESENNCAILSIH